MSTKQFMQWISHCKATLLALFIGFGIYLLAVLFDLDLFEVVTEFLASLEKYELDELVVVLFLLIIGLTFDLIQNVKQKQHLLEIQNQRLRVLKATMTTVLHIVNNFLNNLQLFRMEAEEKQLLSSDSLATMNNGIHATSTKLKILADLDDTPEIEVTPGLIAIDFEGKGTETKIPQKDFLVLG